MAGPWQKFQSTEPVESGPWTRFTEKPKTSVGVAGETPEPSLLSEVGRVGLDVGQSALSGLRSGTEMVIGSGGDASEMQGAIAAWAAKRLGADEDTVETIRTAAKTLHPGAIMPSTSSVQHLTKPIIGEHYTPETTLGEYARTVAEFAPSVALGPGRAVTKVAMTAIPGIASETAGQITEGGPFESWARAAAALAAGAPIAFFGNANVSSRSIAKAIEGATPDQVTRAEQLFLDAQNYGTPITRFEAIQQVTGGATKAGDVQRVLEGSGGLKDFMAARPTTVEMAARRELDGLAPVNPDPSAIGSDIAKAAEGTAQDVRNVINTITEPYYTQAASVRLKKPEFDRLKKLPGWDESVKSIRADPQLERYIKGLPDDSVGMLNEVQKYLRQQADNAAGPMNAGRNMQRASGYGSDADVVRDAAKNASGDFKTAIEGQANLRTTYLDPLLKGPLGKLAKEDLTTQQAIEALFPRNPLPNSADEISRTVRQLSKKNAQAARDLVRAHIEATFNQSTRNLQSGANQFGGASFVAALRGNKQQADNLEAAVNALPGGQQIWKGFDRFLEILAAQGQRQRIGSQTAFNTELLQEMKTGGAAGAVLSNVATGAIQLPRRAMEAFDRVSLAGNVSKLSELITTADGGRQFKRLADAGKGASRAITVQIITALGQGGRTGQADD